MFGCRCGWAGPWNPLLSCWEVVKQGQGQPTKPDFMELMLLDDPARFFAFLSTSDAHEDICGKGRSRLGTGIGVARYHLFRHWHQFGQPRYGVQLNAKTNLRQKSGLGTKESVHLEIVSFTGERWVGGQLSIFYLCKCRKKTENGL